MHARPPFVFAVPDGLGSDAADTLLDDLARLGYGGFIAADAAMARSALRPGHRLDLVGVRLGGAWGDASAPLAAAANRPPRAGPLLGLAPGLAATARPVDPDGWTAVGHDLARWADRLSGAGCRLSWLAGTADFRPLADGSLPIQHVAAHASVELMFDPVAIEAAGEPAAPWIEGYGRRVAALVVADGRPASEERMIRLWPLARAAGAAMMIAAPALAAEAPGLAGFAARAIAIMRAADDR